MAEQLITGDNDEVPQDNSDPDGAENAAAMIEYCDITTIEEIIKQEPTENGNDQAADPLNEENDSLGEVIEIDDDKHDSDTDTAEETEDMEKRKSSSRLFGEYMDAKLDEYTEHVRKIVEQNIKSVLRQADEGHFKPTSTVL